MPDAAPKTVAVDETELANFRRAYTLLGKLYNDPAHHAAIAAALKAVDPEVPLPEPPVTARVKPIEDQLSALAGTVTKLAETFESEQKKRTDSAEDAELLKRINAAVNRHGFSAEGRQAIVDRLVAQNSTDVEGAAAIIAADNPKPRPLPATGMPRYADPFAVRGGGDETAKQLHTDPDGWQAAEVQRYFDEQNAAA